MDEFYIGEIRIFACNYPPVNWMFCDGAILPVHGFQVLFAVIGNRFGGDGRTTFALPDLRGCIVQGMNAPADLGKRLGTTDVTLVNANMPLHSHTAYTDATRPGSLTGEDKLPARFIASGANTFVEDAAAAQSLVSLSPETVSTVGGGLPHNNMQPFLPMNFCIGVQYGEFPPRQ